MTNILLISEDYIKSNSGLNKNIWGSYLTPSIREAQDINLQQILGSRLYKSLLDKVADGTIRNTVFKAYKTLLDDYVCIYLMYQAISDLIPIVSVKLSNLGTVVSNDEHVTNLSHNERELVTNYYSERAEFYGKRLQAYLKENCKDFEELEGNYDMPPTLDSTANTGLWLGGKRGC